MTRRRSIFLLACAALPAGLLPAETREVTASKFYRTFSAAHPPLAQVRPGDTVLTKTLDAGGQDEQGVHRAEAGNPLTGPFYVEGAEPGDALLVRIDRIRMNRNWGWTNFRLLLSALLPEYVEGIYSASYKQDLIRKGRANMVPWDVDLERQSVKLREPASQRLRFEYAARPMLGCVGVAPPGDFAPTSGPSGSYGGNLDYNEIGEGATVILPVYHPGALLFIGDGHAIQADGEPLGTGVETSMDVQFTVNVRKKASLSGPRVETAEHLISIGSQPEFASSLDRGLQMATTDMVRWLVNEYKLEPWAAHLLVGCHGSYQVVTVAGSMALKVPKRHLPAASLQGGEAASAQRNLHPAASRPGMNLDPAADIHPSVILEGKVTVGAYTKIDAGTIITGNVTIGHHTLIRCNVTIRGTNVIGNYTHIYDNVNIEGGRPAKVGGSKAEVADRSTIGDHCWINHGATMHGTQIGDGGAVGINAACDYNTRIGKGAILANGSATHVDQVIPDNSFAEGVPAVIKKRNIADQDRLNYFGVLPSAWTRYEAERIEESIRKRLGP